MQILEPVLQAVVDKKVDAEEVGRTFPVRDYRSGRAIDDVADRCKSSEMRAVLLSSLS